MSVTGIFVEQDADRYASLCRVLNEIDPTGRYPGSYERATSERFYPRCCRQPPVRHCLPFSIRSAPLSTSTVSETVSFDAPDGHQPRYCCTFRCPRLRAWAVSLTLDSARGSLTIPELKTVARADAFLGGDWWREEFEALREIVPPTAADGTSWIDLDDTRPIP